MYCFKQGAVHKGGPQICPGYILKNADVCIPQTPPPLELANVCNWIPPPPLKIADVLCGWPPRKIQFHSLGIGCWILVSKIFFKIRGRSQTTLTTFWLFLTTYPPSFTLSTL